MLPGRRDGAGRLYTVIAAPGATSTLRGGIAHTEFNQTHITTTVSTNFVNGFMVSATGQLVVSASAAVTELDGLPRTATGALKYQADQTPAATDPFVGGIRVGPLGGVYTSTSVPP